MDDLGVPHKLERHQTECLGQVVRRDTVLVAVDRRQHEMVDGTNVGQAGGDLLGPREVQHDAPGGSADLGCGRPCPFGVRTGEHHLSAGSGIVRRDLPTEPGGSSDHDHGPRAGRPWLSHYSSFSSRSRLSRSAR